MKRKVITGIGMLTCLGTEPYKFFNYLTQEDERTDMARRIDKVGISDLSEPIGRITKAGIIQNLDEIFDNLNIQPMQCLNRINKIGITPAILAYKDARIAMDRYKTMSLSYGYPTADGIDKDIADKNANENGLSSLEALYTPMSIQTTVPIQINMILNNHGITHTIGSACASGIDAIADVCNQIELGITDIGIAGAYDSAIIDKAIKGFDKLRVISRTNECRPFDKDRNGFVLGEGGAAFVIEELEHALSRKAKIYAEIKGYNSSCDAVSIIAPNQNGEEAMNTMSNAIAMSNMVPEDIGLVIAHGTGTIANDRVESYNLSKIFNWNIDEDNHQHGYYPIVFSNKHAIGHILSGSGAINIANAIIFMQENTIPDIYNFNEQSESDAKINILKHTLFTDNIINVLVNAYGFGGYNSSIVISKYNKDGINKSWYRLKNKR